MNICINMGKTEDKKIKEEMEKKMEKIKEKLLRQGHAVTEQIYSIEYGRIDEDLAIKAANQGYIQAQCDLLEIETIRRKYNGSIESIRESYKETENNEWSIKDGELSIYLGHNY